jgi:hypothetical protein
MTCNKKVAEIEMFRVMLYQFWNENKNLMLDHIKK